MKIRLETSKGRGIDNLQDAEFVLSPRVARDTVAAHPRAIGRTGPSAAYNCHGLTFASRRTRIDKNSAILLILKDDEYDEVSMQLTRPGDVVIYYSDAGGPAHSGIVVNCDLLTPMVCSKWGSLGEFVHGLADVPSIYGNVHRFFRCRR